MNEKEIITALEHCSSIKPCKSCPRLNEVHCMAKLMGDALELIKSYQERINRIVEQLEDEAKSYQEYYPEDYIFELSDIVELFDEAIAIVKGEQNE